MLTTFDEHEYLSEAMRAGVTGFILKDTPPDELVAAIGAVARGEQVSRRESGAQALAYGGR